MNRTTDIHPALGRLAGRGLGLGRGLLFISLPMFLMLCACEKRQGAEVEGDPPHHATRSSRPARDEAPTRREGFELALRSAMAMPAPEERLAALAGLAWQWLEIRPDLAERALREVPVESGELPASFKFPHSNSPHSNSHTISRDSSCQAEFGC